MDAPASSSSAYDGWTPLNRPAELERLRGSSALAGHLIYSTLRAAPGGLERYDLLLAPDGATLLARVVLGPHCCGHPGIVHGGALAAVLDDAFGSLFFHAGVGSGFTANLSVDYVRPTPAGAALELTARRVRVEPSSSGRSTKVFMSAELRGAAGGADADAVFCRATALFIAKAAAPNALRDTVLAATAAAAATLAGGESAGAGAEAGADAGGGASGGAGASADAGASAGAGAGASAGAASETA